MAIVPIKSEPVPGNTYRLTPASSPEGPGERAAQEIGAKGKDTLIQNHSMWAELQKINGSLNEAAQKQRTGDKILRDVEGYVDRMKAQLERIIKNFPPYPPGSEDRIRILRSYAGFRQLLDQLTIPPPEESRPKAEISGSPSPAGSVTSPNQQGEGESANLVA